MPTNIDDLSYIVDGTGPDGTFQSGDDLKPEIKKTIGDYLSNSTYEAHNSYKIDSQVQEFSYTDDEGYPASFTVGGNNSEKFTDSLEQWTSNQLDQRSTSIKLGDYLSKGRPKETGTVDGHELLKSVVGSTKVSEGTSGKSTAADGSLPIEKQISEVLRSNRFNPSPGNSPYVSDNQTPEFNARFRTNLGINAGGTLVSYEQLRQVGESLLLLGAGGGNQADPASSSGLFIGQGVQLGLNRLQPSEISARNTFSMTNVSRVSLESDLSLDGGDPEHYSYGHVNTPTSPFGGFAPLSMIALGAVMTTTMIVTSQVIFSVLALVASSDGKSVRMEPGPHILGQYGKPEADGLISVLIGPKALGLIHTENDYFDAARRGANVFFGFTGDDLATAGETALLNLIQSPGYYVTVVRVIIRSLNTISNAIRDIDFSNPVGGAQALLGIVDVIKSSKIIAFFNACAAIGDIIITQEMQSGIAKTGTGKDSDSTIDELDDRITTTGEFPRGFVQRPGLSVMKSRSKSGTSNLSLAWRSSASPSMNILPKALVNASIDFGSNSTVIKSTLGGYHHDKFRVTTGNRLSNADVEAFEDAMESEYVPFYMHDLRTNEITSFHAFLKSLTDSFTPSYIENEGYGRIDNVMIYKSTKRSIDLSFVVASTSEEDFDEMWWKINKLTSYVYPQWGLGRQLEAVNTGIKFTQPFSQIPTASPLIRLRVGDVVKGNMSKFNLARIFGMDTPSFSPDPSFTPTDFDETTTDKIRSILQSMSTDPDSTGVSNADVGFSVGDTAILRGTQSGLFLEASPAGNLLNQATAILTSGSARRRVKILTDTAVKIVEKTVKQLDRTKLNFRNDTKTVYVVSLLEEIPGVTTEGVTTIEVTHGDLKIDPAFILVKSEVFTAEDVESIASDAIASFFSTSNNFVVRSFESVAGRGLAGFITNMSFDWFTPTWEVSKRGKRAPQWCEVTLTFSPVHDIPPGLDENGFNRAPIYSVGEIASGISGDVYAKSIDELEAIVRQMYLALSVNLSAAKTAR